MNLSWEVEAKGLIDDILTRCMQVRYVAYAVGQSVTSQQRPGVAAASASESDFYEEMFVNPTVLTLLRRRGELDCGGLRYVVVAYGNFFQLVRQLGDGHLSVCVEKTADPIAVQEVVESLVQARSQP